MTPSDENLTVAGEALDPFAPARVDDTIAVALRDRDGASGSPEGRLVLALAAGHALPAAADAAIERVRGRLTAAPLLPAATSMDNEAPIPPSRPQGAAARPISRAQNALRALAAGLVVALLAGGFVVALHGRQGNVTSASRWVDVSITHAHTTQPLDFNLANGISYVVARTGGDIYACSGTSLWFSDDGGATYAPFTPAPPAGTLDGGCILGTMLGLPGVFVSYAIGPTERISYGEAGGAWRTLSLPTGAIPGTTAESAPNASRPALTLPQGQIYQSIFTPIFQPWAELGADSSDPSSHLAQYAGQWLILSISQPLLSLQLGAPALALIATPDFGKTWVWLDAALFSQSQQECSGFIAIPSTFPTLACLTANPGAQTLAFGLAVSTDFGGTWQMQSESTGFPLPLAIAGANEQSMFYVQTSTSRTQQLMRYDLATGRSTVLATLPERNTQRPTGTPLPLALLPDGTIYQASVSGNTGVVSAGLNLVTPGAAHVTPLVPVVTLRAKGLTATLAFGGLDSAEPALYLGAGDILNTGDISPLYRLALPALAEPPAPTATIQFPYVPAPSNAQLPSECASDPLTTAAIRPGGLGALNSTFVPRWGASAGVAAGTTYFGRYQDTGNPIVGVPSTALAPNARVPNLSYHVDSTAHVTLAQAQSIAATVLPADVHAISNGFGTPPPGSKGANTYTYCSAAFWAAFPPGTPSFTHGELAVTYNLRPDGSVDGIDFSPAIIT